MEEQQQKCSFLYEIQVSDLNTANFLLGNLWLWSYCIYFEMANSNPKSCYSLRGTISLFILTSIPKELHHRQLANLQIKNLSALCIVSTFLRIFSLSSKQASFWRLILEINSRFGAIVPPTYLPTHTHRHPHTHRHMHT